MTTDAFTDRLSEYLDGELSPVERAAVDAHLVGPQCRSTLDALREVVSDAGSLRDSPPARELWSGIAARIAPGDRPTARVLSPRSGRRRFPFSLLTPRQRRRTPQQRELPLTRVREVRVQIDVGGIGCQRPRGTARWRGRSPPDSLRARAPYRGRAWCVRPRACARDRPRLRRTADRRNWLARLPECRFAIGSTR